MGIMILPGEIYTFGAGYWLTTLTVLISILLTVFIYLPVLYNMQATNIFTYLEKRFDRRVCVTISGFSIVPALILYAICIYVPSLALAVGLYLEHLVSIRS